MKAQAEELIGSGRRSRSVTHMRQIRKSNTKPELVVRKLTHRMGYRYQLYRGDLPGTPDLTFSSRRKVVFVHGCFWHQHPCKLGNKQPRSNREYWIPKFAKNRARDAKAQLALTDLGWDYLVLWECEISDVETIKKRVREFLG